MHPDHAEGFGFAAVNVWTGNAVGAGLAAEACLVVEYGGLVEAAFVIVVQVGLAVTAGLAVWDGPYPSWEAFLKK